MRNVCKPVLKFAFALCVIKEGKLFLEIEHRMIRQILCGDFGGKFASRPFFIKADIIGDERFDGRFPHECDYPEVHLQECLDPFRMLDGVLMIGDDEDG